MQWRSTLATTTIAAAMAGYILVARQSGDELSEVKAPAQPGYYLNQATIIETGKDGNPRLKLQAARINQNMTDNSITLQQVMVNYRSEDATPWILTADQGQLPASAKIVHFTGNVFIRTEDERLLRPEIRTAELSIDTENYLATAPGEVDFVMDEQKLSGIGLKYDMKRQKLQLNSQVHGKFLAEKNNE